MHETMIAQNLLAQITEAAKAQNAKPVAAKISCGKLNAINDEVLLFAFEAIAKDTLCRYVKLQIEHKPLRAKCKTCSHVFSIEFSKPQCEKCDSDQFELLPDAPLMLEEIELETEKNHEKN
ncbi:MAG: hydrogenase maturation nickel metallochaperone HypA [Sedimentisphaerales bacterium]|nr:hydrogenase maturation nickel metallochaperone HypA [Sedimentisphaerales bacterium]